MVAPPFGPVSSAVGVGVGVSAKVTVKVDAHNFDSSKTRPTEPIASQAAAEFSRLSRRLDKYLDPSSRRTLTLKLGPSSQDLDYDDDDDDEQTQSESNSRSHSLSLILDTPPF